jgi:hypothetical protein
LVKEVGLSRWIFARDIWAEEGNNCDLETLEITTIVVTKVDVFVLLHDVFIT